MSSERVSTRSHRGLRTASAKTYLGFTGNGSDGADLFLLERVDDTTLPDVGVPDQPDRDLLLVRVEDRKLTQELDQGSLSERVVDGCVKGDRRRLEGEVFDPSSLIAGSTCQHSCSPRDRDRDRDGAATRGKRDGRLGGGGCRTQN